MMNITTTSTAVTNASSQRDLLAVPAVAPRFGSLRDRFAALCSEVLACRAALVNLASDTGLFGFGATFAIADATAVSIASKHATGGARQEWKTAPNGTTYHSQRERRT